MSLPIKKIEGIGPIYAEKLIAVGIKTADELLQAGKTPKSREELTQKTGISPKLILEWVNRADLIRIKGIGKEYSDLLEVAGVDTVVELAKRVPENLHAKMLEVNNEKKLVRRLPTLVAVKSWIEQAKSLPRMVWYREYETKEPTAKAAVETKELPEVSKPAPIQIMEPTAKVAIETKDVLQAPAPAPVEIKEPTTTATPETKELPKEPTPTSVETAKEIPSSIESVDTKLELYDPPTSATKGEILALRGKLSRSDTGIGIPDAKIDIREQDDFLKGVWLAGGNTKEDGSFSIDWKARRVDWWHNKSEIYAQFSGNEKAKPSRTNIQKIIIK